MRQASWFKIAGTLTCLFIAAAANAEVDEARFNKAQGYPPHPSDAITLAERYRVGTMTGKGIARLTSPDLWMQPAPGVAPTPVTPEEFPVRANPAAMMERNPVMAMALVRGDRVVFQKFQYGADESSLFDSQSMAKTFTAIAVGIALDKGYFKSLDEPLGEIVPELRHSVLGAATLMQALQMKCGVNFKFSSEFDGQAAQYLRVKFYPGAPYWNIFDYYKGLAGSAPGGDFNYDPHCSDALSIAIQWRTGKTLREFFEEHVWRQIRATGRAAWMGTRMKPHFTSGANSFFATLHDYTRLAILLANDCSLEGRQIVSQTYCRQIRESTVPTGQYPTLFKRYGLQTWVRTEEHDSWFAPSGAFGQRIYVDPVSHAALVVFALEDRHYRDTDRFWEWFRKR